MSLVTKAVLELKAVLYNILNAFMFFSSKTTDLECTGFEFAYSQLKVY